MNARLEVPTTSSETVAKRVTNGLLPCGNCQAGNTIDRRFCGQCGKPLCDECPSCGVECRTGETFCGGCGIAIQEFLQENTAAAKAALAKAAAFESEFQLEDAIRTLKAVRLPNHREFAVISAQIEERLVRLKSGAERQTVELEVGVARIRQLMESRAYKEAERLLGKLPPALRTVDTDKLLTEAKSKQEEIAALKAEIIAAAEQRRYLELAPQIQRYLTLQPDSHSIRRLANKVRDNLLVAANKKFLAFEYRLARQIISAVPECAIDENTKTLSGRIAEFNWLVDDLHTAPIVDESLLVIAKRFAKKAPGDQKNVDRCSQLFRMVAEKPTASSKRFPGVIWTGAPKRTYLGCEVDWLGGSEQLSFVDDGVASTWNREPGRFFVAAGLALQGLDMVPVPTNLNQPQKQGLLGQLSLGKRKASNRAWGIDIGESSLKVVRSIVTPGTGEPMIDYCELLPYRMPLNRPEAEACRHNLLVETLTTLLAKCPIEKSDRICVSIPSQKILGRSLRMPEADGKKLREMVQFEIKQQIPIPLNELTWTYQAFHNSPTKSEQDVVANLANTLVVAAKRRELKELELIFNEVHIPLHIVQSDALALFNFAMFEGLAELPNNLEKDPTAIALLDVGAAAANVVVISDNRPWFRSFRRGGEDFTSAAARQLHLTKDQAEDAKFDPSGVRRINELHMAFDPLFAQLTEEVQRSIESFTKETGRRVAGVLGVGGGFRLHGLLRYLRTGP